MKNNSVGRRMARSLAALCLGGAALLGSVGSHAAAVLTSGSGYAGGDAVLLSLTETDSALTITGVSFVINFDTGLTLTSISVFDVGGLFNQDSTDAVFPVAPLSGEGVSIGALDPVGRIEFEFLIDTGVAAGSILNVGVSCPNTYDFCAGPDYLPTADGSIEVLRTQGGGTVPEPASLALLAGGLLGLAAVSRSRQRKL